MSFVNDSCLLLLLLQATEEKARRGESGRSDHRVNNEKQVNRPTSLGLTRLSLSSYAVVADIRVQCREEQEEEEEEKEEAVCLPFKHSVEHSRVSGTAILVADWLVVRLTLGGFTVGYTLGQESRSSCWLLNARHSIVRAHLTTCFRGTASSYTVVHSTVLE